MTDNSPRVPPVPSEPGEDRIVIGRFGRPRGVQGEIYITPETDFPERFARMTSLSFQRGERWWLAPLEQLNIAQMEEISGRPVVRLAGVNSPEAAAALTHAVITVPRDELAPLPDGHRYVFELIGCSVVDEQGELLGMVEEVERFPANDAYRVRTPQNSTVLFPAVASLVRSIDIAARRIVVDPAGLFEQIRPLKID